MIKVENLSVSYGDKTVLDSISLEIPTALGHQLLVLTAQERQHFSHLC